MWNGKARCGNDGCNDDQKERDCCGDDGRSSYLEGMLAQKGVGLLYPVHLRKRRKVGQERGEKAHDQSCQEPTDGMSHTACNALRGSIILCPQITDESKDGENGASANDDQASNRNHRKFRSYPLLLNDCLQLRLVGFK